MSKKQARTTKWNYPLMRYLSLLLAVTLLFTGVTFARFALYRDTGMGAGIAKFDVSYTIDGVNSLTFGNQSYWQQLAGGWYAQGGSRTVRVGMYNNSDVDAHAHTLTMEGPAEFWENIALQLTTVKEESESETGYAAGEVVTTQYVLADFLRERGDGKTAEGSTSEEKHNFDYRDYIDWDNIDWDNNETVNGAQNGVFDTDFSDEFGQRGGIEETFQMSGGIDFEDENGDYGSVTAVRQSARDTADSPETPAFIGQDLTITITASMKEVQYSVGYVRKDGNSSMPAFYLDCVKTVPYYTIDITLPDNYTESGNPDDPYFVLGAKPADGSTGEADSVLVFLTWTNSVSSEDLSSDPDIALTPDKLEDVAKNGGEFNGAQVIGYHFNYNDVPATQNGQSIETTVRMNKTTDGKITWEHIASISSGEGAYPHPLEEQENGNYRCDGENYVEIAAGVLGSGKYDGSFDRSEFETTKLGEMQGEMQNDYCVAAEKGYAVRFAVYFEQHSELPEQAGA